MTPIAFDPALSPLAGLYAKWLPLYIEQRTMDDEAAAPFQEPLSDLEKAIDDQPIMTMQDFYYHQTAMSCFGSLCPDYGGDRLKGIVALALAEAQERECLLALIEQHAAIFTATENFSKDTGRAIDKDPEFAALSDKEFELLDAVVTYPTASISNVILKGRYLASLHAVGGLGFEYAQAFVETFALIGSDPE